MLNWDSHSGALWSYDTLYIQVYHLDITSIVSTIRYQILLGFCRFDDDEDDDASPETKAQREKVRRQQNNARER